MTFVRQLVACCLNHGTMPIFPQQRDTCPMSRISISTHVRHLKVRYTVEFTAGSYSNVIHLNNLRRFYNRLQSLPTPSDYRFHFIFATTVHLAAVPQTAKGSSFPTRPLFPTRTPKGISLPLLKARHAGDTQVTQVHTHPCVSLCMPLRVTDTL